jgi:hypothetical protein
VKVDEGGSAPARTQAPALTCDQGSICAGSAGLSIEAQNDGRAEMPARIGRQILSEAGQRVRVQ